MSELKDLRAIASGVDATLIECVGCDTVIQLMNEGANIQAIKLKCSDLMKSAKSNMKSATSAKKSGNVKEAGKYYDSAIIDLKKLKTEADKIEDDHIIMVMLDAFIKSFIPIFASSLIASMTGLSAIRLIGLIGGYICGMSKSLNFSAAVTEKLTDANHQGKDNKTDTKTWWKAGTTRGDVMVKLERMIDTCEKGKAELKNK